MGVDTKPEIILNNIEKNQGNGILIDIGNHARVKLL